MTFFFVLFITDSSLRWQINPGGEDSMLGGVGVGGWGQDSDWGLPNDHTRSHGEGGGSPDG